MGAVLDPSFQKNAIFLRRRRKLLLEEGQGDIPLALIAAILKNIESIGFTFSPALIEALRSLSEDRLMEVVYHCIQELKKLVGDDVVYAPMYPNFPKQVMEASEAELYINAIMHYTRRVYGRKPLPSYDIEERAPLDEGIELKLIDLGTEAEYKSIAQKLISAKGSLSQTDKDDLSTLVSQYKESIGSLLPEVIPHKENLAYVTSLLMGHSLATPALLKGYFKTATDVLRLAVALSGGDVSLATSTRFRNLKRSERKLLLGLVERCTSRTEDMLRYKKRWIRLGEKLHPGDYSERFPRTYEAFDILRNKRPYDTFASQVDVLLKQKDLPKLLPLLQQRPGELARRLDLLLRSDDSLQGEVLDMFEAVAGKVSTPVLLQVMAHFLHRPKQPRKRTFFPKGNVAKLYTITNQLPPLPSATCERVVGGCKEALVERFRSLPGLGKVYIDKALQDHLVPFSQRSASKALRTLVRGSAMPIPPGDTVRFFIWWKEGTIGGRQVWDVDLDLSAVMYDPKWGFLEHISYTNLRSEKYQACHSGDITEAPDGASEFIDIDIPSVLKYGGRYVIMSVLSYSSQYFCNIPECYAGWMMRESPGSGEIYEPQSVMDKVDLTSETRICIPMILDLVERKVIWTDIGLESNPRWAINIESNQRGFVHMGEALTTLVKPDLHMLFSLHAEARGELVDRAEAADTVFSLHEGVTPFETEVILADYL